MREKIILSMKAAMKSKNEIELSTLRLMNAAIKSKDIDHRADTGSEDGISDDEIIGVLSKMVKQRHDSADSYKKARRKDLADRELAEIKIIQQFLPQQLSEEEVEQAIESAISETGASSLKDMGSVMGILKDKYAGQMDFGAASGKIKKRLA